MRHDIVIRGGTVIDGTGRPPVTADVAIDRGRISEFGVVRDGGVEELDARDRLVTPGWVDIHTHYDGQVLWDPFLSPSCFHGVTTVVMGNCGVGFAPVEDDQHDLLIALMEGVEDIPSVDLHAGIPWGWNDFPGYLGAIGDRSFALDVAAQVPHAPLRCHVMGPRGADHTEVPTSEEIARMGALIRAALDAGAVGFSTSRAANHRSADGRPTPTFTAGTDELLGIARAIGASGRGVIEVVADFDDLETEFKLIHAMAAVSRRPLSMPLVQVDSAPERWRGLLQLMQRSTQSGVPVSGQVAARAIGMLVGIDASTNPLVGAPAFDNLAGLARSERIEHLRRPEVKAAIIGHGMSRLATAYDRLFQLGDPPVYAPDPSTSVASRAQRLGIAPAELLYDLMLERDGRELLYRPVANWSDKNLDVVREMLVHPNTIVGLSDAGAHCGQICDAGFPTFLLQYWGRDRRDDRLPLEWLVRRQTSETARFVGLLDRGVLGVGMKADVNVIDFDQLRVEPPEMKHDLPAGGRRLVQRATGYVATIVSGVVTVREGELTGMLPGHVVRGSQPAPTAISTEEQ